MPDVSFSTTIGTILAERIIDVVVLFVLMLAATGLSFGRAVPREVLILHADRLRAGRPGRWSAWCACAACGRWSSACCPSASTHSTRGSSTVRSDSFRGMHVVVGLTLLAWAGEVARLYLVTLSLGLGGISQSVIVFVALASALMTTLPLTPAGLGFAEGAIVGVFLLAAGAGWRQAWTSTPRRASPCSIEPSATGA